MKKIRYLFWVVFFACTNLSAQWLQTNGPEGGAINCLATDNTNLFAGCSNGIFLSTNEGATWTAINNGLVFSGNDDKVTALAISGTYIYAATRYNGIFLSTNNGSSWISANTGLPGNHEITSLKVQGTTLFAGVLGSGVFLSTSNGANWTGANVGLSDSLVLSLAGDGTNLYAGTLTSIYFSANNGASWTPANNTGFPTNQPVNSISLSGNNIYAGTNVGPYLSTNNGASWSLLNPSLFFNTPIYAVAASGSDLFVSSEFGMYYSSNYGLSAWSNISIGLSYSNVLACVFLNSNVFVGTNGLGVYSSSNQGAIWFEKNEGLTASNVTSNELLGSNLFVGTFGGGVYVSSNSGATWTARNNGITNLFINSLYVLATNLYACTNGGVFVSSNNGLSWVNITTSIPYYTYIHFSSIEFIGSTIFVGMKNNNTNGIYVSVDSGLTWNAALNAPLEVNTLLAKGNLLFAGANYSGLFISSTNASSWNASSTGILGNFFTSIKAKNNTIILGTDYGVFASTNNGITWTQTLSAFNVNSLVFNGGTIFAGTIGEVYISKNNGTSWNLVNTGLPNSSIRSLATDGNTLYAGTDQGLWKRPLFEMTGTNFSITIDSLKNVTCKGLSNGSAHLSVTGGTGQYTYQWLPFGGSGSSANGLSAGSYVVQLEDSLGVLDSIQVIITEPNALAIGFTSNPASNCFTNNGSLSASISGGSGSYSYSWSNFSNSSSITSLAPGTYSLTVADTNACAFTDSVKVLIDSTQIPAAPSICLVTVDTLSQHNVIVWEKAITATIDSFRIYREDVLNIYSYVASIGYQQFSEYTDTSSNANPQFKSSRYKMALVDVCGKVSPLSNYHNTVLLQDQQNGNFNWNFYEIQNQTSLVTQYLMQRYDSTLSAWTTINNVAGSQNAMIAPGYFQHPYSFYRVVADLGSNSCTPTARIATGVNNTRSNIKNKINPNAISDNKNFDNQIKLQPNPAKDLVQIISGVELESIRIFNYFGQEVVYQKIESAKSKRSELSIQVLATGIYTVLCKGKDFEVRKKLVVE